MLLSFEKLFFISFGVLCVNISRINGVEYYTKKPDFINSCHIYKPEFTKCSTEVTQQLIDHVVKGDFPELTEKFGSFNPLKLDKIVFKPESTQSVTLEAVLDDVFLTGFADLVIKESRVSKKDFAWRIKAFMPKVHINGKYDMKGRILLIPINGAGNFILDIDNLDIIMHTKTNLYEKVGFTFYNVTGVHVDLNMTGMHSHFDHLFNGQNKEIEESTNQFFNDNWRDFYDALRPIVYETVERILIKLLKTAFDIYPASLLIEDIPTSTELYNKNKSS